MLINLVMVRVREESAWESKAFGTSSHVQSCRVRIPIVDEMNKRLRATRDQKESPLAHERQLGPSW